MLADWSSRHIHELVDEKDRLGELSGKGQCPVMPSPLFPVDTLLFQTGDHLDSSTVSRCHWLKDRLAILSQFTWTLLSSSSSSPSFTADSAIATQYQSSLLHCQVREGVRA